MLAKRLNSNGRNTLWQVLTAQPATTTMFLTFTGWLVFSMYFQITSNERQDAAIAANRLAIQEFREQVRTQQTPLGQKVMILEARIEEILKTRQALLNQVDHMAQSFDRVADRMGMIDRRLLEVEFKLKEMEKPKQ